MMKKVFNFLFLVLRYVLFVGAVVSVFFGILLTYKRLEKPLTDAITVFVPFVALLITFAINLIGRQKQVNGNIIYNLCCVLVFSVTILILIRAKFDTNMVLYFKYGIEFNPSYFSDNLGSIEILTYLLSFANVFLMFTGKGKGEQTQIDE